ncbi:hypothetical protein GCM10022258_39930 [Aquimarina gracilis]
MILKLSNLLDYLLYQADKPKVALQDEMNHIKDYVDLEKMRFSDTLDITMDLEPIDPKIQVAPMLLIPFVENSFKHGSIRNQKLSIEMSLKFIENEMHFAIKNSILHDQPEKEGIGLANIKKRLLLLYKDRHRLDITKDKHWYIVTLLLKL